jgi:hypothetical protein
MSESPCHYIMPRASGVRVEIANKESLRVHEGDELMQGDVPGVPLYQQRDNRLPCRAE